MRYIIRGLGADIFDFFLAVFHMLPNRFVHMSLVIYVLSISSWRLWANLLESLWETIVGATQVRLRKPPAEAAGKTPVPAAADTPAPQRPKRAQKPPRQRGLGGVSVKPSSQSADILNFVQRVIR